MTQYQQGNPYSTPPSPPHYPNQQNGNQAYVQQQTVQPNGQAPTYLPIAYDPRYDYIVNCIAQFEANQIITKEQYRLAQKAYSEITENSHGLWIPDKRGNMHLLLDTCFTGANYVEYDPLYNREAFYAISMHNIPGWMIISEKDFNKPSLLLNQIAKHSSQKIHLYKSESQTSALLRQYISSISVEQMIPFYSGWYNYKGSWIFGIINGTTHGNLSDVAAFPSGYSVPPKLLSTTALTSASQFVQLMTTVSNSDICCSLCLWYHTAVLASLLAEYGYRVPMGLCLHSTDPRVRRHLESILCWFGDNTISLATPSKSFIAKLAERKDQPAVICDCTGQRENSEILLGAMKSGEIPLEVRKGVPLPALHSLPTVISDLASILSTSPQFATIDVDISDFIQISTKKLASLKEYTTDYLRSFTEYVSAHIDKLIGYVSRGIDIASSDEAMSQDGITTYGILLGVRMIVNDFFRSLAPDKVLVEHMQDLLFPSTFSSFRVALHNAADSGCDSSDLATLFVSVTNSMIDQKRFDNRSVRDAKIDASCDEDKAGIVYLDEYYICFTRDAFKAVCSGCSVSGPQMLKALSGAGYLKGKKINEETMQTRITVYDAYGRSQNVRVYKFDRETIESDYS